MQSAGVCIARYAAESALENAGTHNVAILSVCETTFTPRPRARYHAANNPKRQWWYACKSGGKECCADYSSAETLWREMEIYWLEVSPISAILNYY